MHDYTVTLDGRDYRLTFATAGERDRFALACWSTEHGGTPTVPAQRRHLALVR